MGAILKRKAKKMEGILQQQQKPSSSSYDHGASKKEKDSSSSSSHHHEHEGHKCKGKRYGLVSFWEIPEYMKDNEFILSHYRANWPIKEALFSVFRWHNETLNIWTHLLGFFLFVALTTANIVQVPQVADLLGLLSRSVLITGAETNVSHDSNDVVLGASRLLDLQQMTISTMDIILPSKPATRWPFYVFLGGSMFCLLSSSICHLFCCHSHNLNILLLRMDYVGIATMIITSFFPPMYYIFQCDTLWQFIYLGGITAMGLFTVITLLSPALSASKYRTFRALLFCSMGFFGLIPAVHAVIVNWSNPKRDTVLAYEAAMVLFYLIGTGFYVSRIPERLKPGWFDLAGHSHQIFHVFVVLGALAHYGAALVFLEYRDRVGCHLNP